MAVDDDDGDDDDYDDNDNDGDDDKGDDGNHHDDDDNDIDDDQGSKKTLSGRPGQVDFELGQVTFHGHLPDGQAPRQNPLSTKWQHLFQ